VVAGDDSAGPVDVAGELEGDSELLGPGVIVVDPVHGGIEVGLLDFEGLRISEVVIEFPEVLGGAVGVVVISDGTVVDPVDPLLDGEILDPGEVGGYSVGGDVLVDGDPDVLVDPEVLGVSVVTEGVSGLDDEVLDVSLDVLVEVDALLDGGVLDPGVLGVSEVGGDVSSDMLVEGPLGVLLPGGKDVDGTDVEGTEVDGVSVV